MNHRNSERKKGKKKNRWIGFWNKAEVYAKSKPISIIGAGVHKVTLFEENLKLNFTAERHNIKIKNKSTRLLHFQIPSYW